MDKLIFSLLLLIVNVGNAAYLDSVEVSNFPAIQPVSQSGVWTIDSITDPLTITGTVNVLGPLTDAQLRASAVPVSLASVPTHPVTQSGAWTVGVNNFPAVQDVNVTNATLDIGNFPATQAVSGTVTANIGTVGTLATNATVNSLLKPSDTLAAVTSITNAVTIKADTPANQTNALKVDGSAVTQPISGTVSLSGTPNVAVSNFPTVQPVNDNGGSLTVDGSVGITGSVAVTGTFFQATQPVSGTVTANAGTGTFQTNITNASLAVTGPLTDTQLRATAVPVSGSVSITGTPTVSATNLDIRDLVFSTDKVDASGSSVSVSNFPATQPVSIAASVAVTGPLTDTQLRATPVPISGTVSTGGLTDAQLRASAVPVSLTSTTITNFPATQPVSGTVAVSSLPALATGTNAIGSITNTGFNVNNFPATQAISATALPLPTGAATLVEQQTQTTALQLLDNIVGSAGAGTAAVNSALVGGVYNSTLPTLTTGQQVEKQVDQKGRELHPVTNGRLSYIAATPVGGLGVAGTANQDVWRISGSASKTVYIKKIRVSMTATAVQGNNIHLIKRSAANTGGTSTALALVAQDSASPASTASVLQYTAAPTSGAAVGPVRSAKYLIPTATGLYNSEMVFEFGENQGNQLVLRGTAQGVGIVFGTAAGAGANANITVEWEEE